MKHGRGGIPKAGKQATLSYLNLVIFGELFSHRCFK